MNPRFIHLHVHSDYSIIDGLAKIKYLVKKTYELGMPAIAITDFTNLYGLIQFNCNAHDMGIKPIIGADFKINNLLTLGKYTQLTILASNNVGYRNLILLISRAYQNGYNINGPVINKEWLIEFNEGLIILSGGRNGDIGYSLLRDNKVLTLNSLMFYKKYFHNRFYLELIRTGRKNEETYIQLAIDLASKESIPVLATNEVCFINSSDFDAHEIRVCIHNNATLNDPKRISHYSPQQYMRSENEMCELFSDIPEALENTIEVAKRCNVFLQLGKYFLPKFYKNNTSDTNYLIQKSKLGLEKRLQLIYKNEIDLNKNRFKYDQRLEIELKIINKMGFPSYFLIVMEFVQWAKDNCIPVGPGRGSGAGSLVAYALNITEIDPLKFNLIFERFLNPERISLPDFDIDFCMEQRDKVIEHVSNIYGRESVSQIITFGTMAAKVVIRDVGRVLGYPYGFVDRIAKLIPPDLGITLKKAMLVEPQLLQLYQTDKEIKLLINMAHQLEGIIRNIGKHAGGIVISPTKITDFVPIYCDGNGDYPVTQFDKDDVERVGLVKFDFLGLRTLTIISLAEKMINNRNKKQGNQTVKITEIPLNDPISFDILQSAETTAVFQLESLGMRDLIKRLKPDRFEDIIALVALFRPGPLQSGMVENFINRKHGLEEISYPDIQWQHEKLKSVLESTYGIILYQEQVMQIAQVLSGYTLSAADVLRRAIGKKKPEEMAKQRSIFQIGAKNMGVDAILSAKIFDLLEKFAGYGFNKSHSTAYALISYQTLWLKAHYPSEFIAAVMSSDMDNTDKIIILVNECFRLNITIIPPNINFGLYQFHVNDNGEILYGLGAIKGIGEISIQAILNERLKGGKFIDLFDFCIRMINKKISRKLIEKLIMSGAFDNLGSHRAEMMHILNDCLKIANQYKKEQETKQSDIFGITNINSKNIYKKHKQIKPWSELIKLDFERKTLGLYITGHPIDPYLKEINFYTNGIKLKDINLSKYKQKIFIAGILISFKLMMTKNGNKIGICTIDDKFNRIEIVLYTEILNLYQELLKKDNILIIKGQIKFNHFRGNFKIIAYQVMSLQQAREKHVCGLSILLIDKQINNVFLDKIYAFIKPYRSGIIPVNIYHKLENTENKLLFKKKWLISINDTLLDKLRSFVGNKQIKLELK
ncbi:MAG: DNA polymerase III subunit alpha [Pantoea sp. Brub]|nr:DNA polymerase III subunit alpha [Pantoea sp. Brub]